MDSTMDGVVGDTQSPIDVVVTGVVGATDWVTPERRYQARRKQLAFRVGFVCSAGLIRGCGVNRGLQTVSWVTKRRHTAPCLFKHIQKAKDLSQCGLGPSPAPGTI